MVLAVVLMDLTVAEEVGVMVPEWMDEIHLRRLFAARLSQVD